MGFLEKTGKNVDEALEQALNELKTTRDKVNIEVIEEAKNGLFGLFSKSIAPAPSDNIHLKKSFSKEAINTPK